MTTPAAPTSLRIVAAAPMSVKITAPGPPGIPGRDGRNGLDAPGAVPPIEVGFATAADTWQVQHELGRTPQVELLDRNRASIRGKVAYNDEHQTVVTWYFPTAGFMILT